jgi:DNA-binding NtrC family response regulator
MGRVLLVGFDASLHRTLVSSLGQDGHEISEISGLEEAGNDLANGDYEVIFVDQEILDGAGLAGVAAVRGSDPALSIVVVTSTVESGIESIRHGAFDFLTRPFRAEIVRTVVQRACERTRLIRENELLRKNVSRLTESLATSSSEDSVGQLIPNLRSVPGSFNLGALLAQTERELIVRTLTAAGWVQAEAARRMGLSRSALAYKLSKYRIRALEKSPGGTMTQVPTG